MNAERWQKVKALFETVVELAPEEQKRRLDELCGADDELRRAVENLLVSSESAESFLEQPAVVEVASLVVESPEVLPIGTIFGHYEILRQIGAGGMGEVYLARDKKLDRLVAVKILNEKFAAHEPNLQRFTQEAKAVSALNHPNILVIHEIGAGVDANYIVSEYIEGVTLREHFIESPPKLLDLLEISIQIAGALVAAHAAKIVHRDIKPENIMIRPDGYVKILDFGLAKLVEQKVVGFDESTVKQNQTAKGVILGTVKYMSPEQAKGEKVDARTDIFSFGVVLYEMIAGRTPFAGDSVSETFANLINSEPPPLVRFSANAPDELQRIVSKTLRKKKDERYQTMRDLLSDLKSLRENLAFDEKIVKTHGKNVTAVLPEITGETTQPTAEMKNFTGQFARRKSLVAFALSVLFIAGIGFGYYFWTTKNLPVTAGEKRSLAVLPFVNAGQDADAEYLSDGITESVINNLSQLSGLRVMSKNSAFRFRNNQTDHKNIASQLGVENLVTGDIRQIGDKFIINVRLINGSDDSQIWGNQYVKNSSDLIAAQTEIAQAVAGNLRLKLANNEQQQLSKRPTENAAAYEIYLKANYFYFKLTQADINKAVGFYRQAIDLDPNFALAYVGMANAYRTLAITTYAPSKEVIPKAKAAARRALEIDESLAEAHATLGWTIFLADWDWEQAEKELKRAAELAPNNADVHRAYAHLLSNMGRHDEAVSEGRLSRELDPLTLISGALEAQFLFYAGRSEEAVARINKTIELSPDFWQAHTILGRIYTRQGRYPEAIAALRKAKELAVGSTEPLTQLGYALAKSGDRQAAFGALEELNSIAAQNYVPAYNYAMIYNGLDEIEEALNYLEKSSDEREVQMSFIKIDTRWDNLRSEPRFAALIKQMNFE